jgi:hypothetical protein
MDGARMRVASAGLTFTHAEVPAHDGETMTGPFQVGVAFSKHEDVRYRVGQRWGHASYAGGAVICSANEPIVWSRVREPTEALEIYPDPTRSGRAGRGFHATTRPRHRGGAR